MLQPTSGMPTGWVVMCPVDQTALFVPNVLAGEADRVAFLYAGYSRGQIYIVLDENRLAGRQADNYSLMR
jgi:hypothetical protein